MRTAPLPLSVHPPRDWGSRGALLVRPDMCLMAALPVISRTGDSHRNRSGELPRYDRRELPPGFYLRSWRAITTRWIWLVPW
jgi:hypothetical protein